MIQIPMNHPDEPICYQGSEASQLGMGTPACWWVGYDFSDQQIWMSQHQTSFWEMTQWDIHSQHFIQQKICHVMSWHTCFHMMGDGWVWALGILGTHSWAAQHGLAKDLYSKVTTVSWIQSFNWRWSNPGASPRNWWPIIDRCRNRSSSGALPTRTQTEQVRSCRFGQCSFDIFWPQISTWYCRLEKWKIPWDVRQARFFRVFAWTRRFLVLVTG